MPRFCNQTPPPKFEIPTYNGSSPNNQATPTSQSTFFLTPGGSGCVHTAEGGWQRSKLIRQCCPPSHEPVNHLVAVLSPSSEGSQSADRTPAVASQVHGCQCQIRCWWPVEDVHPCGPVVGFCHGGIAMGLEEDVRAMLEEAQAEGRSPVPEALQGVTKERVRRVLTIIDRNTEDIFDAVYALLDDERDSLVLSFQTEPQVRRWGYDCAYRSTHRDSPAWRYEEAGPRGT